MTAIVLPDIDRSTLQDLKQRMPSLRLADIELPSMERAGRQADQAIDRLLGRSRPSVWPWLAAAIGIAAIVGTVAAVLTWGRRPGWSPGGGSGLPGATDQTDSGIDVTAAYGETSITGTPDTAIGETDFAVDAGTSPFEERQP
jgi:hypothetical protein